MKPQGHGLKEAPFTFSYGLEWRHGAGDQALAVDQVRLQRLQNRCLSPWMTRWLWPPLPGSLP